MHIIYGLQKHTQFVSFGAGHLQAAHILQWH